MFTYLSFFHLSIYLSIYLSMHPSINLSTPRWLWWSWRSLVLVTSTPGPTSPSCSTTVRASAGASQASGASSDTFFQVCWQLSIFLSYYLSSLPTRTYTYTLMSYYFTMLTYESTCNNNIYIYIIYISIFIKILFCTRLLCPFVCLLDNSW